MDQLSRTAVKIRKRASGEVSGPGWYSGPECMPPPTRHSRSKSNPWPPGPADVDAMRGDDQINNLAMSVSAPHRGRSICPLPPTLVFIQAMVYTFRLVINLKQETGF